MVSALAGLALASCSSSNDQQKPSPTSASSNALAPVEATQILDDIGAEDGLFLLMGATPLTTDLWHLGRDGLHQAPLDHRPPLFSEIESAGRHVVLSAGGVSSNGLGDTIFTLDGTRLDLVTFPSSVVGVTSPAIDDRGMLAYVASPSREGTANYSVHVMPLEDPQGDETWFSTPSSLGLTTWGPKGTCAVISNLAAPPNDQIILCKRNEKPQEIGSAGGMTSLVWGGGPYLAVGYPGYGLLAADVAGSGFILEPEVSSHRWPLPAGYSPLLWDISGARLLAIDSNLHPAIIDAHGLVEYKYAARFPAMVYQSARA